MSIVWSNELELSFIECLRAEPVLWDINLKDYKNKLKSHDAWMRISTVMEIPIADLKKKKDSLMSSYRSYKGKVKKSVQSGAGADEIYQPIWFAYEAMDAFLGDNLKCKKSMNTERGVQEPKEVNLEAIEENVEEMNENRSNTYSKKTATRQSADAKSLQNWLTQEMSLKTLLPPSNPR
ncbi:jg26511 [Pararge aegeria aegeria]|uniref:Jg26511 protein n=1 Tax=Pararge aegeria aegeria TaxID=348720 RepID=A0A8S4QK76_9NEOP|nr:jg26511 [Pararge aegeria aegeria]